MKNKDFTVFIITHGRPNNIKTLKSLQVAGYTGTIHYVVDNEDKAIEEYQKNFGKEYVKIFDKKAMADQVDEGNNFDDRKTTTHARNACFDIAEELGYKYFVVFDDDYTSFMYRFENKLGYTPLIKNIDAVFDIFIEFFKNTNIKSIAFSQGGDHIGGFSKTMLKRKCMNSFFCSTERRFWFVGQLNEDVNTYVMLRTRGDLFFTFTSIQLVQAATQKSTGGMSEAYLQYGTYCKSFTTTMMHPSGVKVSMMHSNFSRIHHAITWNNTVPCILSEIHKK